MTWGAMAQRESLVERAGTETPSFQKPQGSFPFCFEAFVLRTYIVPSFSFAKSKVDFADPTMVISRAEDSGHSGKLLPTSSNPFVISSQEGLAMEPRCQVPQVGFLDPELSLMGTLE